ncbi:MAG: DUF4097 and DUF4098 domain-containing protein YvlB [Lentisphaeria bacterium]|jgi:DUF4097 and DUF4098 domain-containing protein YvlB
MSVTAETSGGSIDINSSNGPVKASTADGSISISKAKGFIEAETAGDSIKAELIESSKKVNRKVDTHVTLEAIAGSVTVYLPEKFAAIISTDIDSRKHSRSNYRIYFDFPISMSEQEDGVRGSGEINGGGSAVELRAVNGDTYIKKTK